MPVPEYAPPQNASDVGKAQVSVPSGVRPNPDLAPPAVVAWPYAVHRGFTLDSWYVWSLTDGRLIFSTVGGRDLGLAAAPVCDGLGIGFLESPLSFRRVYCAPQILPEFQGNPQRFLLDATAAPNAAPLAIVKDRGNGQAHTFLRIYVATSEGLSCLDLNQIARGGAATFTRVAEWSAPVDEVWSPVFVPGVPKDAVLVPSADGRILAALLDHDLRPSGTAEYRSAPPGALLHPLALSSDGLWLVFSKPGRAYIRCVDSPQALEDDDGWHEAPDLVDCIPGGAGSLSSLTPWPPYVLRTPGQLPGSIGRRVMYLGTRRYIEYDGQILRQSPNVRSRDIGGEFRCHPAYTAPGDYSVFVADFGVMKTGLLYAGGGAGKKLAPITADLIGTPFWFRGDVYCPTASGLHRVHVN